MLRSETVEWQIAAQSLDLVMTLQADIQALEHEVLRLRGVLAEIGSMNPASESFDAWSEYYRQQYLKMRRMAGAALGGATQ